MKITRNIVQLAIILLVAFIVGCKVETINSDDIATDFNRSYDLAAPLVNIHASGSDLFEKIKGKMEVYEYPDGTLYGSYSTTTELSLTDMLTFSDQHADLVIPAFSPLYVQTSGTSKVISKIKLNDLASVRYDSLTVFSGQLSYNIKLPAQTTGTLVVSFPELFDVNNNPLVITTPITSNVTDYSASRDLVHYKMRFSHGIDSSYIRAVTTINFTNTPSNSNATSEFHFTISQISPDVVFGYFGKRQISSSAPTMAIDFFDEDLFQSFKLAALYINVITKNYVGASFSVGIKNMVASNTETQQSLNITFTDADTRHLNAAVWENKDVPTIDSLKLSRANSNILDALDLPANQAGCSIVTILNPDNSSLNNYISRDSKIETTLQMQLPLWFRTQDFMRQDTIDFDLNDMLGGDDQIDRVDFIKLNLQNVNGFPFDIEMQAYLTNGNYQVIDSLFAGGQQSICRACTVKANYRLDKTTQTAITAQLDKAKIKKLRDQDVKYIILVSKGNTSSNGNSQQYIKIFKENYMNNSLQCEISASESIN